MTKAQNLEGQRVLILTGKFKGNEGICLGPVANRTLWAISPDDSKDILTLVLERDFGLLVDLSANPGVN